MRLYFNYISLIDLKIALFKLSVIAVIASSRRVSIYILVVKSLLTFIFKEVNELVLITFT